MYLLALMMRGKIASGEDAVTIPSQTLVDANIDQFDSVGNPTILVSRVDKQNDFC